MGRGHAAVPPARVETGSSSRGKQGQVILTNREDLLRSQDRIQPGKTGASGRVSRSPGSASNQEPESSKVIRQGADGYRNSAGEIQWITDKATARQVRPRRCRFAPDTAPKPAAATPSENIKPTNLTMPDGSVSVGPDKERTVRLHRLKARLSRRAAHSSAR